MEDIQLKKMDRMMSILTYIQSKKITTAQYLAEKFDVSLRTIYRDIKTLISAGIPIIGESGSGYSIMEGYKLPPIMFTLEEALSFVSAEKLMGKYFDSQLYEDFINALIKIKAILRWSDKLILERLDHRVLTFNDKPIFNENVPNAMSYLIESIARQKILIMEYRSIHSNNSIKRSIEPIGIYHKHGYWYVYAWDYFRSQYRNFRTDRIQSIEKTDHKFSLVHPTLIEYLDQMTGKEQFKEIKFSILKEDFCFISDAEYKLGNMNLIEKDNYYEVCINVPEWNIEGTARFVISCGDKISQIQPEEFRVKLLDLLESLVAQQKLY